MQIFIKFLNRTISYVPIDQNDRIIVMKRYLVKRLNIFENIHFMYFVCSGRILNDSDLITDKINENATVHANIKLMTGPESNMYLEKSLIYFQDDAYLVQYYPNSTMKYIIEQIVERLVNENLLPYNVLTEDFHLEFKSKILPNNSVSAEYPELSKAYISFNDQDNISEILTNLGVPVSQKNYYQMISLGERVESTICMRLQFGKSNIITKNICLNCNKSSNVIMPCCRKKSCISCLKDCLTNNFVCNLC